MSVHAVYDAVARELRFEPVTDEDLAGQAERAAAWQSEQAAAAAEQERVRALAAAESHPLMLELARRAGLA